MYISRWGDSRVNEAKAFFLSRTRPWFYRRRRQNLQDFVQTVQSPFKSPVKKKPKCSSSPRKTIGSKIHTPKGKFQFPKKVGSPMNKHSKLGTPKSKVPRLFSSTPKKSKRSLISLIDHNYSVVNTGVSSNNTSQTVAPNEVMMDEICEVSFDDTFDSGLRNPDETFEFIALDSLEETFKLKMPLKANRWILMIAMSNIQKC